MTPTHILSYRLDRRRGDRRNVTVAYCGFEARDVSPSVLYPDRDQLVMAQGMGGLVADLRAFAADEVATCKACKAERQADAPGWAVRLWRWITGTTREPEPAPDLLNVTAEEARHPDDDGAAQ